MTPDPSLIAEFIAGAAVSLTASWLLVVRLERVGARLRLSEAMLGMVAALAADAPEITASVTALAGHQARIGAGVTLGSNVFNLAALLGLATIVSGQIVLHRRVIALESVMAVTIAGVCVLVVLGVIVPAVGLAAVASVLGIYLLLLASPPRRLVRWRVPARWATWLSATVREEESELQAAIHPTRGTPRDGGLACLAVLVVVVASVAMEQAASKLGARHGIPEIVTGALVLAAVTSLPNAVAAVYLARRGRGAATLSTAMNSNAINVAAGFLLPATIVGVGGALGPARLVAVWYLGMTILALATAYCASGLRRAHGVLIVLTYLAFACVLIAEAT